MMVRRRLGASGRLCHLLLALVLAVAFVTGCLGIDYGKHWDEQKITGSVAQSMRPPHVLLPDRYNYPSMVYDLALLATVTEALPRLSAKLHGAALPCKPLSKTVRELPFKLRVRTLFLIVVLLSCVWTYLLIHLWRESWAEALLGASLLACSWEVAYHARWIAPDGILMQFGILTVLLSYAAVSDRGHQVAKLRLAAVAAGLSLGTKYPGGIFLLPVILANWHRLRETRCHSPKRWVAEYLVLVLLFCATFLATTPGAVIEFRKFVDGVQYEIVHYRSGHGGYTVGPVVQHGVLLVRYLALAAFSRYWLIALLLSGLLVPGACSLLRETPRSSALMIFSAPLLYVLYMSTQSVMIVRNYLAVIPFMAILSARGAMSGIEWSRRVGCRTVVAGLLVVSLTVNLGCLIKASQSVKRRTQIEHGASIVTYLRTHNEELFFLSPGAAALLPSPIGDSLVSAVHSPERASGYILLSSEVKEPQRWVANRQGFYKVISGVDEVNFDYYPTWVGDPKVILLPVSRARDLGILAPSMSPSG